MNPIKSFFSFLYNDFKEGMLLLKEVFTGKYKPRYSLSEFFDFKELFKDNKMLWMWLWIITLAFCLGYLVAAKRYEVLANNVIIETCSNINDPGINPFNAINLNLTNSSIFV